VEVPRVEEEQGVHGAAMVPHHEPLPP
jgi:hypothetical protein